MLGLKGSNKQITSEEDRLLISKDRLTKEGILVQLDYQLRIYMKSSINIKMKIEKLGKY